MSSQRKLLKEFDDEFENALNDSDWDDFDNRPNPYIDTCLAIRAYTMAYYNKDLSEIDNQIAIEKRLLADGYDIKVHTSEELESWKNQLR